MSCAGPTCLHALRATDDDVARIGAHPGRIDFVQVIHRCDLPTDHDGLHEASVAGGELGVPMLYVRWDRRDGVREWVVADSCPDGADDDDDLYCGRPVGHDGPHGSQYRPSITWPFLDEPLVLALLPGERKEDEATGRAVWLS